MTKTPDLPDYELWDRVKATVTRLLPVSSDAIETKAKQSKPVVNKPVSTSVAPPIKSSSYQPTKTRLVKHSATVMTAFDPQLLRQIKQGKRRFGTKIDLHGYNQQQAYDALLSFIQRSRQRGQRLILVITGKGQGGEGVLRRQVPGWLSSAPFSDMISAIQPALPQHGGRGALYVLLKK